MPSKAKVKLLLKKLNISGRISLTSQIVTAMTANPNFTTPNPPLADLTAKKAALIAANNDAEAKYLAAKNAIDLRNDLADELDALLTREASYVENIANGDNNIIMSAGMQVRDERAPVGVPAKVLNLGAAAGDGDGKVDLNWDAVRGANSYVVQTTSDPNVPDSWAFKTNSTSSFCHLEGLTSGNKYWYRVAAVGAAGQGSFSDECHIYAP